MDSGLENSSQAVQTCTLLFGRPRNPKHWQCWSTKVFYIRVYATPLSHARFNLDKNCWNASRFVMGIAASYCWVWAGGHYRIFSNIWWGIRHHCRTVREGLYDFMWVLFGVRAPSILRPMVQRDRILRATIARVDPKNSRIWAVLPRRSYSVSGPNIL